ncbi:LysR family transcriptional regulator [Mesorhizobium sp. VK24D]|uniref:LysR family transcriptional regulator n=1 Tax=Mesorhizobium album TaxID=3072314 RepID=A0ABU4Y079_9HYPH|nr:LysR family transcriptional regulator [Mesorhizobium sp. VK24D]MDX8480360.1 LysR family transcriptional regulator [Mesorhizobium sp. VK24D]
MEMHQIRYFLAAARTLSFTRAAEFCGVSQPALTTAIKKLEANLGTPLFYREGHRLQLSEFGRRMEPSLARIVEQTEMAETAAENFRLLNQAPIRLGVMSTIGPLGLSRFLADFERDCPGVEVAVSENSPERLADRLAADELDLAILNARDGLGESYRSEPLYTERYVVLLPPQHPLKEKNGLTLQDLSEQPYVDRLSCEMREMVIGLCESRDVKLYARFRSEREDWVQAMVMANIGFAFMPEHSVTHPDALRRPLVDPIIERTISLVSLPGRRHSPGVAAFVRASRGRRWPA